MLQVWQFTARLFCTPPDTEDEKALTAFGIERVQAIVEFPMIGFLLALVLLNKKEWDIYAEIDYSYGQTCADSCADGYTYYPPTF